MFMTIFLTGWTLLHLYVFWRLTSVPAITRRIPRKVIALIGLVLWASAFLRRFLDRQDIDWLATPVEWFTMNWLGALFLISCCLLAVDIITIFGLIFRRWARVMRQAAFIAGILLTVTALVQGNRAPVIDTYEVTLPRLAPEHDGLVVAAISDTHVGRFIDADWLAARVEQINDMHPDLVLMLGDIFEGDSRSERQPEMIAILRRLTAPLGVWAVTGNHESHGGRDAGVRFLEGAGIRFLRNEWVSIAPDLALGGVDDAGHWGADSGPTPEVTRTLASRPPGPANIFLSHRPRMTEAAAAAGVELMLSGHTHGGQIWPFSYLVKLANPLLAGRYRIGSMTVIVSRGAGTWGPRMRLWRPGEILKIILRSPAGNK